MVRIAPLALAAATLFGCSGPAPAASDAQGATAATASAGADRKEASAGVPVTARAESVSTDTYSFDYSYPAAAGAIPGVREWLDADLDARKAEIAEMAAQGQAASKQAGFPFNSYDFSKGWEVVTDLPAWLSLSAGFSTYTGGAHPNHGFDALLWDKRAESMRDPTELFQSERAFADAVRPAFCKALDAERAKKRDSIGIEGFDECIEPTEPTIILGSSNGKAFDRIGFLIAPYMAGPYVEGSYEVTLPVTPAILGKVKAGYRSSFVAVN